MAESANTSMNTFCYAPWSNIEILPNGKILPCCKFQDSYYEEKFNIVEHSIEFYRSSNFRKLIKQEFQQGHWPQGCERCRIEETSNIPSKRQLDFQRWEEHYKNYNKDTDQILTISAAIGNTCNLKCIMCNPSASSLWAKEYKDVYNVNFPVITEFRKNTIRQLIDYAPELIHLDIHGGEPFLSGIQEHENLLDSYISTGQAKNISIHYTTNGTIWPTHDWFERWKYFKEIDLQISIDGIGRRYEYIRYPANWNVLEKHANQYLDYEQKTSNFRLSIAHTVSAYNVYYMDEFFSWCKQTGLPKPWTGKLHNPPILRPTVWHENARFEIVRKLESSLYAEVNAWADHMKNNDDSLLFEDFKKYVHTHDSYRYTDFMQTFVEMSNFLK